MFFLKFTQKIYLLGQERFVGNKIEFAGPWNKSKKFAEYLPVQWLEDIVDLCSSYYWKKEHIKEILFDSRKLHKGSVIRMEVAYCL